MTPEQLRQRTPPKAARVRQRRRDKEQKIKDHAQLILMYEILYPYAFMPSIGERIKRFFTRG